MYWIRAHLDQESKVHVFQKMPIFVVELRKSNDLSHDQIIYAALALNAVYTPNLCTKKELFQNALFYNNSIKKFARK